MANQYLHKGPPTHTPFLFVFRFFSGLRSIKDGVWDPQGTPAIYKLLEYAARQRKISTVLFFCKTPEESGGLRRATEFAVQALPGITFTVIPFYFRTGVLRVDNLINSLVHTIIAARRIYKIRPALLYCDRAHLGLAALVAWGTRLKVVVRMLGVAKLGELYERRRNAIVHPIHYFSVRAPFAYVICSKDGSPARHVLGKFLHKKTPYVLWLNGVESTTLHADVTQVPHDPIRILFSGRFDHGKGCLEFVEAIWLLNKRSSQRSFTAVMVGGGMLEQAAKVRIAQYKLNKAIMLTGHVAHAEMWHFYANADIYVSLNILGNLSNSVLEALASGICTIVLRGDSMIDTDTDELLPEDIVPRVGRANVAESLAVKLEDLLNHPERIQECARRTRVLSNEILENWEERLGREWALLENLCKNRIHRE